MIRTVLGRLDQAEAIEFASTTVTMKEILKHDQNTFTRCSVALSGMLRHREQTREAIDVT